MAMQEHKITGIFLVLLVTSLLLNACLIGRATAAPAPPGHCMGRYVRDLSYARCISGGYSWIKPNGTIICYYACKENS